MLKASQWQVYDIAKFWTLLTLKPPIQLALKVPSSKSGGINGANDVFIICWILFQWFLISSNELKKVINLIEITKIENRKRDEIYFLAENLKIGGD